MSSRKKVATPSRESHRGIKVKKFGGTWWGQRWIEALEHLSRDYLNRLGRGRAYARAGHVHDLHIAPGVINALVSGSEEDPYQVTLRVAMISPTSWHKVIDAMSRQAVFSAELLAGRMPKEIDSAFRAARLSLFLTKQRELETDCSCPDWANPCKHVAAVHYVLGEAFDKDPFLLFELRGRTKQQVLGALRALRLGQSSDEMVQRLNAEVTEHDAHVASDASAPLGVPIDVTIGTLTPIDYERLPQPLPTLQFRPTAPSMPGTVLKQLGAPPSWSEEDLPFDVLAELHIAAGRLARAWALQTADGLKSQHATTEQSSHHK